METTGIVKERVWDAGGGETLLAGERRGGARRRAGGAEYEAEYEADDQDEAEARRWVTTGV